MWLAAHPIAAEPYGGGIDLGFDLDKLLHNMQGYLDQGLNGVKLKVGRPTIAEDIARVAAIRELIGPDRALAADANYSMSVAQAIEAARGFAEHNILWFEEPTSFLYDFIQTRQDSRRD